MKQLTMKEIQKESCKTAREHGFHDPFYIPEKLCLIHSEISEAIDNILESFGVTPIYRPFPEFRKLQEEQ